MCGRYSLTTPLEAVRQFFDVTGGGNLAPRYNIAPTQEAPVIRPDDRSPTGRILDELTWGLVPSWAKDPAIGTRLINARAETVSEKASFRAAFRRRRCLVPADGFYEWQAVPGGKQPYRVTLPEAGPFAFAGLWEHWRGRDGQEIKSFTILTTDANAQLRPIHTRMPVILPLEAHRRWLDPSAPGGAELLRPYAGELHVYAVSRHVNSPKNDDPECVAPLDGPAPISPNDQPSAQDRLL